MIRVLLKGALIFLVLPIIVPLLILLFLGYFSEELGL